MQCQSPISIPRPNGVNQRDRITVPCGKCMACLSNKRSQWSVRLQHEHKTSKTACFITLTYSDENLPRNKGTPTLRKSDYQSFMKRLRKLAKGRKLKYYAVGEYGSKTYRPHYHAIMFNLNDVELIEQAWTVGNIKVGTVTEASISYVCKYVINKESFDLAEVEKPFSLMSKGLGKAYIEKMKGYHSKDHRRFYVTQQGGVKVSMPRYYREKIYNSHARKINGKLSELEKFQQEMDTVKSYESKDKNFFKAQLDSNEAYARRVEKSSKQGII